jgi:hypothetical protein
MKGKNPNPSSREGLLFRWSQSVKPAFETSDVLLSAAGGLHFLSFFRKVRKEDINPNNPVNPV